MAPSVQEMVQPSPVHATLDSLATCVTWRLTHACQSLVSTEIAPKMEQHSGAYVKKDTLGPYVMWKLILVFLTLAITEHASETPRLLLANAT